MLDIMESTALKTWAVTVVKTSTTPCKKEKQTKVHSS